MSKTPFGYDYCGSCLWNREHVRGVRPPEACPACGNGITYLAYTGGGPARMIREIAALRRQLAEAQERAREMAELFLAATAPDQLCAPGDEIWECDRETARAILAGEKGDPSDTLDAASTFAETLTDDEAGRLYGVMVEHMPPSDTYCPADATDQQRVAIALRYLARPGGCSLLPEGE